MAVSVEVLDQVTDEVVDGFGRLLPQLSRSAGALDKATLERLATYESNTILVARTADKIVGTLTLVMFPIPTGVRARIEDVVVDENARGQGIGAVLTEKALELAKKAGARSVDLTSRPDRAAANRLYQRLGFHLRDSNVYRYTIEQ